MKISVRKKLIDSVEDYKKIEREKWILNHPG